MTKSGLGEDVILAVIKQTQTAFRTTPKDLVDLKKAKVSEAVIEVMINAVPVPLAPAKPAVDPGRIIKEGVGWNIHLTSPFPRRARPSFTEPDPGVEKTGHRLSTGQPRRSDGTPLQ